MVSERLKCYEDCPFRGKGLIRPCAKEVYEKNQYCIEKIRTDPSLDRLGAIIPYAGMDEKMNHQVEIRSGKKAVAILERGAVTLQS